MKVIISSLVIGSLAIIVYSILSSTMIFRPRAFFASPAVYEGMITYQFEGRGFLPCNLPNESWWVSSKKGDIGYSPHYATVGNHHQLAYVKALMEVSVQGEFGHFGMSDREVVLLEIEEFSSEIPKKCAKNLINKDM